MSNENNTGWQHLRPSATPLIRVPLRCRVGLHGWQQMGLMRGMAKRMVSMRRGCTHCGKITIYKIGHGWAFWGYHHPDKLTEGDFDDDRRSDCGVQ